MPSARQSSVISAAVFAVFFATWAKGQGIDYAGIEILTEKIAQYAQITDKVVAAIRKISPEPIRYLVNTHVHIDHTGATRTS
jgi:glyoxylase-like metal-dependent hydrolase (beta-lactamase superfamily II)